MVVRLLTAQVQPARLDEALHFFRDSLSPTLAAQPGFRGAWLLLDRNTCKSITLLMWETESYLRAGEAIPIYQQQVAEMAEACATTPTREVFDVGSWFAAAANEHKLNTF